MVINSGNKYDLNEYYYEPFAFQLSKWRAANPLLNYRFCALNDRYYHFDRQLDLYKLNGNYQLHEIKVNKAATIKVNR